MKSRRELGERREEGGGRRKEGGGRWKRKGRRREGTEGRESLREALLCVFMCVSVCGLGLVMRLPLRIFCYLALEINSFAAESLLIKGAFNLQMGIKNTRPRVTEAWSGSLFGHSFPSYSTAWPPK